MQSGKENLLFGSYFVYFIYFTFLKSNKGMLLVDESEASGSTVRSSAANTGEGRVTPASVQSGLPSVLVCFFSPFKPIHHLLFAVLQRFSPMPRNLQRYPCSERCSWKLSDLRSLPASKAGEFALEANVTFLIQVDSFREMPTSQSLSSELKGTCFLQLPLQEQRPDGNIQNAEMEANADNRRCHKRIRLHTPLPPPIHSIYYNNG